MSLILKACTDFFHSQVLSIHRCPPILPKVFYNFPGSRPRSAVDRPPYYRA